MLKKQAFGEVTRFDLAHTLWGRGRYWTTCYLLEGLLVDSGCAHTAPELLGALEEVDLRGIANTHSHEDHIGANGILQRQNQGLEIQAHRLALPVLAAPRQQQPLHPYRRLFWGFPEPSQGKAIEDGAIIETDHYRLRAIHTPGHSTDHLCFYEESQGWLFSGDLFVGGRERALRQNYDILGVIASLKLVAKLPIEILFAGSARVRNKPEQELAEKIAYLEELSEQVQALYQQGYSVGAITRHLMGKPQWVEFVTLGHFTRRRLVLSYLGMSQDEAFP